MLNEINSIIFISLAAVIIVPFLGVLADILTDYWYDSTRG